MALTKLVCALQIPKRQYHERDSELGTGGWQVPSCQSIQYAFDVEHLWGTRGRQACRAERLPKSISLVYQQHT